MCELQMVAISVEIRGVLSKLLQLYAEKVWTLSLSLWYTVVDRLFGKERKGGKR